MIRVVVFLLSILVTVAKPPEPTLKDLEIFTKEVSQVVYVIGTQPSTCKSLDTLIAAVTIFNCKVVDSMFPKAGNCGAHPSSLEVSSKYVQPEVTDEMTAKDYEAVQSEAIDPWGALQRFETIFQKGVSDTINLTYSINSGHPAPGPTDLAEFVKEIGCLLCDDATTRAGFITILCSGLKAILTPMSTYWKQCEATACPVPGTGAPAKGQQSVDVPLDLTLVKGLLSEVYSHYGGAIGAAE